MGVLTVLLERAENLKDTDMLGGGKSDPYVLLEVEQDNLIIDKDFGEKRSTVKKDDLNPVYNETFTWELPTLNNMKLWVKVMDEDNRKFMDDDFLGKDFLNLEKVKPTSEFKEHKLKVENRLIKKDAFVYIKVKYEA